MRREILENVGCGIHMESEILDFNDANRDLTTGDNFNS
jgi:hypothetical protein